MCYRWVYRVGDRLRTGHTLCRGEEKKGKGGVQKDHAFVDFVVANLRDESCAPWKGIAFFACIEMMHAWLVAGCWQQESTGLDHYHKEPSLQQRQRTGATRAAGGVRNTRINSSRGQDTTLRVEGGRQTGRYCPEGEIFLFLLLFLSCSASARVFSAVHHCLAAQHRAVSCCAAGRRVHVRGEGFLRAHCKESGRVGGRVTGE